MNNVANTQYPVALAATTLVISCIGSLFHYRGLLVHFLVLLRFVL